MIKKLIKFLEKVDALKYANSVDYQYLKLCKRILDEGVWKNGRNGRTKSVFGAQMNFDMSEGVPLITTRKIYPRVGLHELIWFLRGDTNSKYLKDNNIGIWDLWIKENGDLPNTYPMLWRKFPNPNGEPVDQIQNAIDMIRKDPHSRRIIVSSWHAGLIKDSALPPCHNFFQFTVEDGKLSCHFFMRSCDINLGFFLNAQSYYILTHLIIHLLKVNHGIELKPGKLIWTGSDVHIYENQIEAMMPIFKAKSYKLPKLWINPELKSLDDLKFEDLEIRDYKSSPAIKIPVSK